MERLSRIFPAKRESILSPNESRMAAKSGVSTKPAPLFWDLFGRTGQHCPSPVPPVRFPTSTPKPRAEGRVRASGTQVTSRPERSGDQVLLPLPIHLSPGLAKTAWPGAFSSLCDPGHGLSIPSSCCIRCCPLTSARNRFLPPFSPPAPKTHPVSPFSGISECVSLFLSSFDPQNLRAGFCASCRIVVTS